MTWQKHTKRETYEVVEGIGLPLTKTELRRRSLAAQYALRAFAEYLEVPEDRKAVLSMVRTIIDHDTKAMNYLPGPNQETAQFFPADYIYPVLAGRRVPSRGQVKKDIESLAEHMEARLERRFTRQPHLFEVARYMEALAFVLETLQEAPEFSIADTRIKSDYQPDPLMPREPDNLDDFVNVLTKFYGS